MIRKSHWLNRYFYFVDLTWFAKTFFWETDRSTQVEYMDYKNDLLELEAA